VFILFPFGMFLVCMIVMRRIRRHVYCANLSLDVIHWSNLHEKYIYKDKDKYNPAIINVYIHEHVWGFIIRINLSLTATQW